MSSYGTLEECLVIVEKTGHYGLALEQYLQDLNITLYKIHVQKRPGKRKTDKRDALGLANTLYSQIILGVQVDDSTQIRRQLPPSATSARVRGLAQRRIELTQDITVHKNRLTSICDELFPELTEIFKDPNKSTALAFREKFPTPVDVSRASIEELLATRIGTRPSGHALLRLQELAKASIGTRDPSRLFSLRMEQTQLIVELRLLQAHIESIEAEIEKIVETSREGKILASIPGFSLVQAAIVLANVGNIANFERVSWLRGYCGWAPVELQSGTSLDSVKLSRGGNKILKRTVYLISWAAVRHDSEFKAIYDRLVPIKCRYDERTKAYHGRNKVMGRICGQLIGVIFALLRHDHDLLLEVAPGTKVPEPVLYSRELYRQHRLHGIKRC